jgi:hypothetical protein
MNTAPKRVPPDILKHPLARPPRRERRRRKPDPPPEREPDAFLFAVLRQIQHLNHQVTELSERVLLGALRGQINHRRIERLENALAALQGAQAASGGSSDGKSASVGPGRDPGAS